MDTGFGKRRNCPELVRGLRNYEFNNCQQIPISDAIVVAGVLKSVRVCSGAGMVS